MNSLINVDRYIHPCKHWLDQDIEHFNHPRKFPCVSSMSEFPQSLYSDSYHHKLVSSVLKLAWPQSQEWLPVCFSANPYLDLMKSLRSPFTYLSSFIHHSCCFGSATLMLSWKFQMVFALLCDGKWNNLWKPSLYFI